MFNINNYQPETLIDIAIEEMIGDGYGVDGLILQDKNLYSLPQSLINNAHLITNLNLSNNNLTELPDVFHLFKNLKSLNLSSNQLTSIPPSISKIVPLRKLNIVNNQINHIPEDLFYYVTRNNRHANIDLSKNQIKKIDRLKIFSKPSQFKEFLGKFWIRENPIHEINEPLVMNCEIEFSRLPSHFKYYSVFKRNAEGLSFKFELGNNVYVMKIGDTYEQFEEQKDYGRFMRINEVSWEYWKYDTIPLTKINISDDAAQNIAFMLQSQDYSQLSLAYEIIIGQL
jgi:hypothetical protein